MADLPILFSGPMVRAILREIEQPGTGKTQTRRVLDQSQFHPDCVEVCHYSDDDLTLIQRHGMDGSICGKVKVAYRVGDRLYVREAWRASRKYDETPPRDLVPRSMTVLFEAGGSIANQENGRWEPSSYEPDPARAGWVGKFRQGMNMPRWASRITLIVTDVRVERLQDISEADARAEGIANCGRFFGVPDGDWDFASTASAVDAFSSFWDSLNADRGYGWDANPWVAAYTFRPILGNIDQIQLPEADNV